MCVDSRRMEDQNAKPLPDLLGRRDREKDLKALDHQLTKVDIRCFGRPLARRFRWLESAVGRRGLFKFQGGKLAYEPYGGQYVLGVMYDASSHDLLCQLIDELWAGNAVQVCDTDSYYRAGKRWPLGVQIIDGKLVDVWDSKDKRKLLGVRAADGRNNP